jgi:hypothetical protein
LDIDRPLVALRPGGNYRTTGDSFAGGGQKRDAMVAITNREYVTGAPDRLSTSPRSRAPGLSPK